jgi:hypothetical protein
MAYIIEIHIFECCFKGEIYNEFIVKYDAKSSILY